MLGRLRCMLGLHAMDAHGRSDGSAYRKCARCGKQVEEGYPSPAVRRAPAALTLPPSSMPPLT